jgi:phenylacetate-CoA ligase
MFGWISKGIAVACFLAATPSWPLRRRQIGKISDAPAESLDRFRRAKLRALLDNAGIDDSAVTRRSGGSVSDMLGELEHAKARAAPARREGKRFGVVIRKTSGTSGVPKTIYMQRAALAWQLAARDFCFSWFGIGLGDREARFWRRESSLRARLRSRLLNRRVFEFPDPASPEAGRAAAELRSWRADYFYGYSSLILNAAQYYDRSGDTPPRIKLVVCTAESLQDWDRAYIGKIFDCPVALEYGCTEVDIVAFTCPRGVFHVMAPNVVVEIENRVETDSGIEGDVVLTGLDNSATLVVRERIGDTVVEGPETCPCGNPWPTLRAVGGRSRHRFVTLSGQRKIHAGVFSAVFRRMLEQGYTFRRFQVIQKDIGAFLVNIWGAPEEQRVDLERRIATEFAAHLEPGLDVAFEHDVDIDRSKREYFRGLE